MASTKASPSLIRFAILGLFLVLSTSPHAAIADDLSLRDGIYVSRFSGLSSAVSSQETKGRTIVVDSPVTTCNLTIPADRSITVSGNGIIAVGDGCTLTILGPFSCGQRQAFTGKGVVKFSKGNVPEIYPQWWGAVADGRSDCYHALRNMYNSFNLTGGGKIVFPKGRYWIAEYKKSGDSNINDLIIRNLDGVELVGYGAVIDINGSFRRTADRTAGKRAYRYSNSNAITPFRLINCKNVTLRGFEIDGNTDLMTRDDGVAESFAHGISIEGGRGILISDINVHHCQSDGVYVSGFKVNENLSTACRNLKIENVKSSHNARQGLSLIQARDVVVADSVFSYSGVTGGEYGGHAPMAGLDIEPNLSLSSTPRADVVTGNIIFDKCRFEHNAGSQVTAAYADRTEKVSFKNCSIDATGSPSRYSMILAVADGLIEDSRIETGSGNFNIGWSSPYMNVQKTVVRRCKITGSKNVIQCATEGAVLIEGCNIRNTAAVLERNTYVPYLMDKNCIFRNNRIFVPKPGATGQRKYQIANRLNVAESSNNIFETDLSNTDYHLASGYGKYTRVINDGYSGSFRPFPNAKWEAHRPYSK
ncbi:hypothetical protein GPEL0_01f0913 [Geoanaerobacter pelophilus]|uniref:Right handed beta helix domain-containing protein n=1 Tax=Geoanaerobacter pelophilus TaxID=60036 RepID=A0ABQ0MFG4_9BACT|nr:right-handed parallel beta-helix repeat-containing protein [Geoanaerobacter pelophilus]GAW65838.1 hypothetical protein GPEL0_01f0913 [Geoanaerobacter pelophilus]